MKLLSSAAEARCGYVEPTTATKRRGSKIERQVATSNCGSEHQPPTPSSEQPRPPTQRSKSMPRLLKKGGSSRSISGCSFRMFVKCQKSGAEELEKSGVTSKGMRRKVRARRFSGLRSSLTSLASILSHAETVATSNRSSEAKSEVSRKLPLFFIKDTDDDLNPVKQAQKQKPPQRQNRRKCSGRFLFRTISTSTLSTATLSTTDSSNRYLHIKGRLNQRALSPEDREQSLGHGESNDLRLARKGRQRSMQGHTWDELSNDRSDCSELTGTTKKPSTEIGITSLALRGRRSSCRVRIADSFSHKLKEARENNVPDPTSDTIVRSELKRLTKERNMDTAITKRGKSSRCSSLKCVPDCVPSGIDFDDSCSECSDLTWGFTARGSFEMGGHRSSLKRIPGGIEFQTASVEVCAKFPAHGGRRGSKLVSVLGGSDFECSNQDLDSRPSGTKDTNFYPPRTDDMRPARKGRRLSSLFSIPDDIDIECVNMNLAKSFLDDRDDSVGRELIQDTTGNQGENPNICIAPPEITGFLPSSDAPIAILASCIPRRRRCDSLSSIPSQTSDKEMFPLGFRMPRRLSHELLHGQTSEPAIRQILDLPGEEETSGTDTTETASLTSLDDESVDQLHIFESDTVFSSLSKSESPTSDIATPMPVGSQAVGSVEPRTQRMPTSALEEFIAAIELDYGDSGETNSNITYTGGTGGNRHPNSSSGNTEAPPASRVFLDQLQSMDHRQIFCEHREAQSVGSTIQNDVVITNHTPGLTAITSSLTSTMPSQPWLTPQLRTSRQNDGPERTIQQDQQRRVSHSSLSESLGQMEFPERNNQEEQQSLSQPNLQVASSSQLHQRMSNQFTVSAPPLYQGLSQSFEISQNSNPRSTLNPWHAVSHGASLRLDTGQQLQSLRNRAMFQPGTTNRAPRAPGSCPHTQQRNARRPLGGTGELTPPVTSFPRPPHQESGPEFAETKHSISSASASLSNESNLQPQGGHNDTKMQRTERWSTAPSSKLVESAAVVSFSAGSTPLYHAVSSCAPYSTIQSLIEANPLSTGYQNGGGLTPLHCGIERYDTPISVLQLLLQANPSTAWVRSKKGETPIDLLWKRFIEPEPYRSEATRQAAVRLHRLMESVVDDDGCSPGRRKLNDSFQDIAHKKEKGLNQEKTRKASAIRALYSNVEFREFWDLMTLFIKAGHNKTTGDTLSANQGNWQLVHAAVEVGCAPLFIRFAVALHPDQIRQRDQKNGLFPLHIAAAACSRDQSSIGSRERIMITILSLQPGIASYHDRNGRLPLTLAIESHKSWFSIKSLLLSSPQALLTSDSTTQMLPFMGAAVGENANVDIIYRLLRENPLGIMRSIK